MELQETLRKIGSESKATEQRSRGMRRLVKDGEISPQEALAAIETMKTQNSPSFLAWCKSRIKRGK